MRAALRSFRSPIVLSCCRRMRHRPIGLAVVGCGHIVRSVHLPVLRRLGGVEVVAVVDSNPQRWPRGLPGFQDYREALVLPGVDAVLIATPSVHHAAVAIEALEAQKHVYIEKPLATNLADADGVRAAWRRAGVVGMMGLNYRFNPLVAATRATLQRGRLGAVRRVRSWFTTAVRPLAQWRQRRATGGGVLLELASHHFDWVPWVMGRSVVSVQATLTSQHWEADTATVRWKLEGDVEVESFFSLAGERDADGIEITGAQEVLRFDRYANRSAWLSGPRWWGRLPGGYWWRRMRSVGHEPSYKRAWQEFRYAVHEGRPVHPDLEDGYQSLRVVLAAEESAAQGYAVSLG